LFFGRLLTLAIRFQLPKCFVEPFVCHLGLLTIGILRGTVSDQAAKGYWLEAISRVSRNDASRVRMVGIGPAAAPTRVWLASSTPSSSASTGIVHPQFRMAALIFEVGLALKPGIVRVAR
jgi:hypothetical protein